MSRDYPSKPSNAGSESSSTQPHEDDAGIEDLLREIGARDEPSAQLAEEVRRAVHAEWREVVELRQRRRHVRAWALAAGVAGVAAATVVGLRINEPGPVAVATVVKIEGHPQVTQGGQLHDAALGEVLATGMQLQTEDARVAFTFGSGASTISVRVDAGSQLRFLETDRIQLNAGALYVDAGTSAASAPLIVQTEAGSVRHVGTQYQVRTVTGGLSGIEVSIREGRVEIASDFGTNTGVAGERVAVSTRGTVLRSALPAYDASWQWASNLAPPFDIGGRSLSSFLEWMARETGRTVTYGSPAVKRAAEELELGGSIANVDPNTAFEAVRMTTKSIRMQSDRNVISVSLARD